MSWCGWTAFGAVVLFCNLFMVWQVFGGDIKHWIHRKGKDDDWW